MCKYYTNLTFSPLRFGVKKRKNKEQQEVCFSGCLENREGFHSWLHHLPARAVHQYTPDGREHTSQDTAVKQSQS